MAKSAYDLMLAGQWYNAADPELDAQRVEANALAHKFNLLSPDETTQAQKLLTELFGEFGEGAMVLGPVWVDYGSLTRIGKGTFVNHGAYFMDGGGITIGKRCQIGPHLGAYSATHPLFANERATGLEMAKGITIEDDVWIGANVVLLPGVHIGKGAVIGAGSVVTHDVPAGAIAAGNPCRVMRNPDDKDRVANVKPAAGAGASDEVSGEARADAESETGEEKD